MVPFLIVIWACSPSLSCHAKIAHGLARGSGKCQSTATSFYFWALNNFKTLCTDLFKSHSTEKKSQFLSSFLSLCLSPSLYRKGEKEPHASVITWSGCQLYWTLFCLLRVNSQRSPVKKPCSTAPFCWMWRKGTREGTTLPPPPPPPPEWASTAFDF